MKKTISIVIIIIVFFIVFFMIGLQILNSFESNTKEIEVIQENENSQKDNTQTSETSSQENIFTNSDIEATKRNGFEGIIEEVDIAKKEITVVNPSHLVYHELYHADSGRRKREVIIDNETYIKAAYLLCLDNVPIKDYNGNKIEVRDLKVGDTINVKTINLEYTAKILYESLTSDNIILIERKSKN